MEFNNCHCYPLAFYLSACCCSCKVILKPETSSTQQKAHVILHMGKGIVHDDPTIFQIERNGLSKGNLKPSFNPFRHAF